MDIRKARERKWKVIKIQEIGKKKMNEKTMQRKVNKGRGEMSKKWK